MKADPGRVARKTIFSITARLKFIQQLNLPSEILANTNPDWIGRMYRRVVQETSWEMLRHKDPICFGLYQKVDPGRRTTQPIGSISSSRSSPAGEGKPADTPSAPTWIVGDSGSI